MNHLIEKLYDEIHGPKLTPYELLENMKLKNYLSVDFTKDKDFLIGITKCYLPSGELAIFKYFFDTSNKLMKLISQVNGNEEELYNREKSIAEYYNLALATIYPSTAIV